jgi:hypothetical protein
MSLNVLRSPAVVTTESVGSRCLVVAFVLAAAMLQPRQADAQSTGTGGVTIRQISGPTLSGALFRLDRDSLVVTSENGSQTRLSRPSVVSVETGRVLREGSDRRPRVVLTNGDCLVGELVTAGEESLTVAWPGGEDTASVPIPLEFVASAVFTQPNDQLERSRRRRQWGLVRPTVDRVLLQNGTSIEGELLEFDTDRVRIETTLGTLESPQDQVTAILLNKELSTIPQLPQEYAIVSFEDGSRLTLEEVHVDAGGNLHGRAVVGLPFKASIQRVVRIQFFNERIVSLADLKPVQYTFRPYFDASHPLVVHRNVYGGRLKLRGTAYATGLGMHSHSEVTYDLTVDGFRSFFATVGIDDEAAGRGQAVFAVEIDEQRVYETGHVSGLSKPVEIGPISLSGAGQLTLIVEFGRRGNILDVADWCDPLLLK